MSKKDFFRVIIKLFGLYSLVMTLFSVIPTVFSYSMQGIDLVSVLLALAVIAIIVGIYIFLLQKVDVVIQWLKLDKGFDDDRIEIGNFDSVKLVSFATILIGGFLIVDYFPSFIHNCYLAFRENIQPNGINNLFGTFNEGAYYFDWAISTMNIILGYLLLTNYRRVAYLLAKF